jgi:hypothetical protein
MLLVAILASAAIRSARALCAGPIDTYGSIVAAREQQRQQATGLVSDRTAGLFGDLRATAASLSAGAIDLVLVVKQSDPVAFPAHVVAGIGLEVAGCDRAAIADQWLKAARHAWSDWPARVAADGIARVRPSGPNDDATMTWLARDAAEQPWFAPNLDRVVRQYRSIGRS